MEQKEKPLTRAQELRKNATKEENHLWYDFLRTYPVQFLRQKPFGPYIVDFYCHKAKLAIELDGSQHYEGNGPEQDKIRTAYLQEVEKIRVLRFTNLEIKQNFEGVCAAIDRQVRAALPSSGPAGHLPPGEGHRRFMKTVTIYTDGACSGNPGPGGWGAILQYGEFRKELSGGEPHTTNNRMELTGVITALEALKEPVRWSSTPIPSTSLTPCRRLGQGWRPVGGSSRTRSRPSTLTCGSGFSRCASATPSVSTGSRATRIIPIITAVTSWRLGRAENINKPLGPRSSGAALAPYITLHVHRARHETVQRLRRMKCLCMWAVPAYALSSHGRAAVSGRMANSAMLLHSK